MQTFISNYGYRHIRLDAGGVGVPPGALRANHDVSGAWRPGRCPARASTSSVSSRPGSWQRGRQLHRLGGGRCGAEPALRRWGKQIGIASTTSTAASPGSNGTEQDRADRAHAPGGQDVHLAAGGDRGDARAAVRHLYHDRLHPVDYGAGRGRLRGGQNWSPSPAPSTARPTSSRPWWWSHWSSRPGVTAVAEPKTAARPVKASAAGEGLARAVLQEADPNVGRRCHPSRGLG